MKAALRFLSIFIIFFMACGGVVSAGQEETASPVQTEKDPDPDQIHFAVYIVDVDDINGQAQSFTINTVMAMVWTDERLAHEGPGSMTMPLGKVWNPRITLVNSKSKLRKLLPEVVEVEPDGTVTYRQQYVGPLSQPLDLKDFPVDTQRFSIHFAAVGFNHDELEFIPYEWIEGEAPGGGIAKTLSLPDWEIIEVSAESRPYMLTETIGAAGFALDFIAERHFAYYLLHVILVLVLIVMISWAPFWVNPTKASIQTSLSSAAVLTFIAYRFLLANTLPKLPYLTRLDYLTLGGTILVFCSFIEVLVTTLLAQNDRESLALKVDLWCRVIFPLAFTTVIVLTFFG